MLSTSCVSVELGKNDVHPADDLDFESPSFPFERVKIEKTDQAWISKRTGNTLSFLSECGKATDLTLDQISEESYSVLDSNVLVHREEFMYQKRKALQVDVLGKLDGIPIKARILAFKKNGCNFSLNYVALEKSYSSELEVFSQFVADFSVP